MRKITLLIAVMFTAIFANAQSKSIVADDPMGDAGMGMGAIDVKALSYSLSTDKKMVTFKVELHSAVTDWNYGGFFIHVDEDMNPANGLKSKGNNQSMKADRIFNIAKMSGMWMATLDAADPMKSGSATSKIAVAIPDTKSLTITMPVDYLDGNADGKMNMVFMVGRAGSGGTITDFDELPNSGYSTLSMLSTTGVSAIKNQVAVAVYPNPATSQVTFNMEQKVEGTIVLLDLSGKTVATEPVQGTQATIAVAQLANGLYLYQVKDNAGAISAAGQLSVQK